MLNKIDNLIHEFFLEKNINKIIIILLLIIAFVIRILFINVRSIDFELFLSKWYFFIHQHGFGGFKYNFYNYSPAYVYLIAFFELFHLNDLWTVKFISIIFDFILSYSVFLVIRYRYRDIKVAVLAGLAVLFAPVVILDGAAWGQCDSVYTSFLILCLYFILKDKYHNAFISYSLAFIFKFQSIFLFPLLIILIIKKRLSIYYLFYIPLFYIISIIPSFLAGRNLFDLLVIYPKQSTAPFLNAQAPNIYLWLSNDFYKTFNWFGILITLSLVLLIFYFIINFYNYIKKSDIIVFTLLLLLIAPSFLPQMHERYFYDAEIISIIFAFYFPRYFYIPIVLQAVSFVTYTNYLFGTNILPFRVLPFFELIILGIVVYIFVKRSSLARHFASYHPRKFKVNKVN